ncbi:MAG: sugar ABC transporter ATP-binding protein [Phycisphaerae bacterium]|nr:sugar ABC transporter ATP-binding protein [Phycisphaerae bacterium]
MPSLPTVRTILRVHGIGRRFAGVAALDGIDAEIRAGEVLAIVGENGAGKSTLLKILSGVLPPSTGSLEAIDDHGRPHELRWRSVAEAAQAGIAFVHQEPSLADHLDLAGAILLGREHHRLGWLNTRSMRVEAARWLARVGLDLDPSTLCGSLSIAQRQLVEIAKALSANARILILDEPTSSLGDREIERLLAMLDELRRSGVAIVYVSHHLDEVLSIADRAIVLRDGRIAGTIDRASMDRATLERLMVGRDLAQTALRPSLDDAPARLVVDRVISAHRQRHPNSLTVKRGEIVGLAGLVGSGRTRLLEAIAGLGHAGGSITLDGRALGTTIAQRVASGVAIVPEDRARHGLFTPDPVSTNISMAWLPRGAHAGVIDRAGERDLVAGMITRLRLRPANPARRVQTLSGGNQQKTMLGRWLSIEPSVLLLDEPTRGVDVGARHDLHEAIRAAATAGCAVLFASSDLEEVLALADRILVMHDGAIVGEFTRAQATELAIMSLATGGALEAAR